MAATRSPGERLALIRQVPAAGFCTILPRFIPRFGIGMAAYNVLTRLSAGLPDGRPDPRTMMRSLPHNVTTEMDLLLWQAAQAIRADSPSLAHFTEAGAATLAAEYLSGQLRSMPRRDTC